MSVTILVDGIEDSPDLNMANGNFFDVWHYMGLDPRHTEIEAKVLKAALKKFRVKDLVCDDIHDGNLTICGRDTEQVTRYYWKLMEIVKVAEKNNALIVWG